jgi:hypothetical protein
MFFCPKCSFMLDISKYSSNNDNNDKYIIYNNTNNFIDDVIKNKININNNEYKITFQIDNIKNSNKFKKKKKDIQNNILNVFEDIYKKIDNLDIIYNCINCGFKKELIPNTILYSESTDKLTKEIENNKINILKSLDNTYPRTRNYICQNKDCNTHKKEFEKKKEAIFFRLNSSNYDTKYLCCECNKSWNI